MSPALRIGNELTFAQQTALAAWLLVRLPLDADSLFKEH